jgi:hypothetical protein
MAEGRFGAPRWRGLTLAVSTMAIDGAFPGSKSRRTLSSRAVPARVVWMAVTVAFILALPSLWNIAAYGAVTAINVVGITPAYAIPIYLRARQGSRLRGRDLSAPGYRRPRGRDCKAGGGPAARNDRRRRYPHRDARTTRHTAPPRYFRACFTELI